MMSTPLLNYPQTGILGMHNIVKRAMVIGEEIKIRPMMYVALSYDHRVVDGREAVSFLVAVKDRLEAPERLMLEA
jgi:2-oxoglutarate dehydrogenase E2 component (dihydrolipoamide succinyltransferase)